MWRHGDVFIAEVEAIPAGAIPLPHCVLAEGELTGHCHRVDGPGVAELLAFGLDLFLKGHRRVGPDRPRGAPDDHAPSGP